MENVWAFYRRSTDKQELSIDDQRRECQAFAARNNWQIVKEFEPRQGYGSGLTIDRDESFLGNDPSGGVGRPRRPLSRGL